MDYLSYIKNAAEYAISSLRAMSTSKKIAVLCVLAFIALILYLRVRNTAGNNIRRARELHQKAVELNEKGKAEEAASYYQKAADSREKAEAQK